MIKKLKIIIKKLGKAKKKLYIGRNIKIKQKYEIKNNNWANNRIFN